jgi:hypothetical protein
MPWRGAEGSPVEVLSRLSVFAASSREAIESLDLNPLLVLLRGRGSVALDAVLVPRRAV